MELIRYVHNNPVRAGVVQRASESGWSSHRIYLGLEEKPSWLATEAIFGGDISRHEEIRWEFAEYVDEGRGEERRAEFSGEVSPGLARRIRRLMGGEVTLSYPILGPDSFVVESLKQQVIRHRDRVRAKSELTVEEVTHAVFEALGLAPELACSRSRSQDIAHGRALVAWLWAERLGRPQVMVAEALRVKSAAVSIMLRKLRGEKPSVSDVVLMDTVIERLTENGEPPNSQTMESKGSTVAVLKRKRK
jgi:putative transposase